MDLNIFKTEDKSGKMAKESYVCKNHTEEYNFIIDNCKLDIPFKEKVYIVINGLNDTPKCQNPNCNNSVKFKNSTIGYLNYCSKKCISSDPNIILRKEIKSIEKFGTKTPSQSKEIKDKIIKTNNIRYGGNSPMSSNDTQEKSKQTLLKNYGVTCPSHSEDISKRRIESFKTSNHKETYKNTSLERYGTEHPWMNKDIHKKTIDFFYQSYKERIEDKIDHNKFEFKGLNKGMTTNLIFKCKECENDFHILPYQFYSRINNNTHICTNCFPISENASISQIELYNFIKNNYDGEIISDCKNIIKPYEIDIYIPKLNLGFEFNGVWWHSDKYKPNNYHLDKYEKANENGIKLITIWEDDWLKNREICESFIINKLNKTDKKIYARNCIIKEISYNESKDFLYKNHLQGDCKSSTRIGLFNNDILVSLMTFSKLRLPLQRKEINRNKEKHYELTRFCNILNTNVVGGASKILNYFINKYKPLQIETYSDNLISDGYLYEKLGFEYSHTSNPGYWYVIDGIREHRFNWRKQKLIKMGYDPNKTEEEIMSELGYHKIYNAGNKKWIYKFNIIL